MGWIRTVKPELFTHELLYDTEYKSKFPIRLAFIALFTQCDSEGRFMWRPRILKLAIMPYDSEINFSLVMDVLLESGFVVRYEADNEFFGYIPTWKKHQRANGKKYPSHLPPPPGLQDLKMMPQEPAHDTSMIHQHLINDTSISCQHPVNDASTPERNRNGNRNRNRNEYICEVSSETPSMSVDHDSIVIEIFNHWQSVMSYPKAKFDPKRQKKIEAALELGYTVAQLKQAIDGCSMTPHNMGENTQGKKYNNIGLIFRDADHIERFIQNSDMNSNVSEIDKIFEGAI